ncbi:MAG: hypothetical protein C7B45_17315 [Sulfobacillus acidophilus]|uniref:Cell envelope-related transcriptional attenuator domain-containing protein n=1 Tax=Sulfobacillus acidophilus TaxID=53633 RepID=A0A2T2WCJ9_9FIRM|nr:MAG: hypothetical protein C7B45_17315 [Sulfobacillus acidophilus]
MGNHIEFGFRRAQLVLMLLIFVVGGVLIWFSVNTHSAIRSHVDVLNTRRPMNVLVAVQGTPLDPGFVGFIANVKPNTRILRVVPIAGNRSVTVNHVSEPLYQAISDSKPAQVLPLVSRASGVSLHYYFFLDSSDLFDLLDALYYHTPHWPSQRTPLTMLKILGYPNGRIEPRREIVLLSEMVNRLPLMSPIAAGSLLSIPRTALTNLSSQQLFLLANYVRGDELQRGTISRHHSARRAHG